jgi:hypothetical protein
VFAPAEIGWHSLAVAASHMDHTGRDYAIVDAADLRSRPTETLAALCDRVGLPTKRRDLHRWTPISEARLGQLNDQQRHWYARVLSSDGLRPVDATPPALEAFPVDGGFRHHVAEAVEMYKELLASSHRLRSAPSPSATVGAPR